jgi:hypothetical protein
MADLTLHLDDKMLERLQSEAKQRNVPLEALVSEALEFYFDDDDEPTKEEILETLRQSMLDALAGKGEPIEDVLAELRAEYGINADES